MNKLPAGADTITIDGIIADLLKSFRLEYKKLLKADFNIVRPGLTTLHFLLMRALAESGSLPISEIGKKLSVPRPQMTHLTDQLISLGLVIRIPDAEDRRITRIGLTAGGRSVLAKCKELVRENVKNKLSYLGKEELAELSLLLKRLGIILAGLDTN